MISWKYSLARLSQAVAPDLVSEMLTTQPWVGVSWAIADFTMWPVSLAGPAR